MEPMRKKHADDLLAAARESDWTWMSVDARTRKAMVDWISAALRAQEQGLEFPFTVIRKRDRLVLGSTRYLDVRQANKGVEIGATWYRSSVWGTIVNPECKYLLLKHAFDDWGAVRVQLKTDVGNIHSQKAILKLGAKFEGRLRNHRFRQDGSAADSMLYSITDQEWRGDIEASLASRIEALRQQGRT